MSKTIKFGSLVKKISGTVGRVESIDGENMRIAFSNNSQIVTFPTRYGAPVRLGDNIVAEYVQADLIYDGRPEATAGGRATGVRGVREYRARETLPTESAFRLRVGNWGTYGADINRNEEVKIRNQ